MSPLILILAISIEFCAVQSENCSITKIKCINKGGTCQGKGTTCSGKIWSGKRFCGDSKNCDCCEPYCAKAKRACKSLNGKCIGQDEPCNGTSVIGNAFCKKNCKCCYNCGCSSIDDRCTGPDNYCIDYKGLCPQGYETTYNDCAKPVTFNGTRTQNSPKPCKCCKLVVDLTRATTLQPSPTTAAATTTDERCDPIEGRCAEKGAYCEKHDVDCKEGYEGVEQECTSDKGPCQCCKPIIASCPVGFIDLGTGECFKYYKDQGRTWSDAQTKCTEEAMYLAEPSNQVVARLYKYMVDTYDPAGSTGALVWLGAKADGSAWWWQRSQTQLSRDHPAWYPGYGTNPTLGRCLRMSAARSHWNRYPGQPYYSGTCSYDYYFTLCQM